MVFFLILIRLNVWNSRIEFYEKVDKEFLISIRKNYTQKRSDESFFILFSLVILFWGATTHGNRNSRNNKYDDFYGGI